MPAGRKRKPSELKKLHGTYRADTDKPTIQTTIELSIEPPSELNEWGTRLYKSIMTEYSQIGLVAKVDIGSLLLLCNEFGTYCEADDIVKAKGLEIETEVLDKDGDPTGRIKIEANPMIKVRNDAFKNYKALCTEFGLTPASRTSLNMPKQENKNPFSEL